MKKPPWTDVLVVVLISATGAILEIIKILKQKGKGTSCQDSTTL